MTHDAQPGSFADRVASRRVNLVKRYQDGIPPAEYLAGSNGILRRGKRHYLPAPKKVGKSLGSLVLIVDVALAGESAVIFDRENGADLYADRLQQIVEARELDEIEQAVLAGRIAYYEFPRFRDTDEAELVELCNGAGLVSLDSQRMFLTDLGLEENANDDYAAFMGALVDPLFRAGIATLILDNAGHENQKRGRGASAKGDLNETLFSVESIEHFDAHKTGRLRLEITDSRFGDSGRWELTIGGGTFGSWQRADRTHESDAAGFRPTGKMERASIFVETCSEPVSRNTITDAIGGNTRYARVAVEALVREHYFRSFDGPRRAQLVESIRPYREADDPHLAEPENETTASLTASLATDPDCVPTASEQLPLNHAENTTASDCVPTASATASNDCVPVAGPPYGGPPTASRPTEEADDIPF